MTDAPRGVAIYPWDLAKSPRTGWITTPRCVCRGFLPPLLNHTRGAEADFPARWFLECLKAVPSQAVGSRLVCFGDGDEDASISIRAVWSGPGGGRHEPPVQPVAVSSTWRVTWSISKSGRAISRSLRNAEALLIRALDT